MTRLQAPTLLLHHRMHTRNLQADERHTKNGCVCMLRDVPLRTPTYANKETMEREVLEISTPDCRDSQD